VRFLHTIQQRRNILILVAVTLALWFPRGLALDRFVTADEPKWLARSGNFYLALVKGDLAGTFTREHPGVMATWIGMAGLFWRFPEYPNVAPGRLTDSSQIEPIIRLQDKQPMEILEAGRVLMVLFIVATLVLSFWEAARLAGLSPALVGFSLIAFDPFHAGLTRLLHLDGLMSSLMLLSILAYWNFLFPIEDNKRFRSLDLAISAVAAGLGWLTKSPALFLAPFLGFITLVDLMRILVRQRNIHVRQIWQKVSPLLLWTVIGGLVFVLLWPAMWVDPIKTLQRIFAEATTYATEGHTTEVFFNGLVTSADPGLRFYPTTYLWRTTPVVLVGLMVAGMGFVLGINSVWKTRLRWAVGMLVLFSALFGVFMTLGSKKFDRYLLPIFAPLDLVAGIGWIMAANWLRKRWAGTIPSLSAIGMLTLVVAFQASAIANTYPYYLSYYNPMMGGSARAPGVMMIGWGEGLDEAARYLNSKPGAAALRVMSWYPDGPFSYIFNGHTVELAPEWEQTKERVFSSDYVVFYIHEWQRKLPFPEMLDYFARQTPEHVVTIDGIEYAQIYNMQMAPPP